MVAGARVRAIAGKHEGDTGTVVSVNKHGVVWVRFDATPEYHSACKPAWLELA